MKVGMTRQNSFVMRRGGRNAHMTTSTLVRSVARELLLVAPEFENEFSKYTTNDLSGGNLFSFGTKNQSRMGIQSLVYSTISKQLTVLVMEHYLQAFSWRTICT
jgi:hypothetical protein